MTFNSFNDFLKFNKRLLKNSLVLEISGIRFVRNQLVQVRYFDFFSFQTHFDKIDEKQNICF